MARPGWERAPVPLDKSDQPDALTSGPDKVPACGRRSSVRSAYPCRGECPIHMLSVSAGVGSENLLMRK